MKKTNILPALILALFSALITQTAVATGDAITTVYLVTHDYNMDEYDVTGYQYSGCYGLSEGPQTATFTEPFLIQAKRGCGGIDTFQEDVNALSCATSEYEWDEGHNFVQNVTIDISGCEARVRNSQEFQLMIKKAARKNFRNVNQVIVKK